MTNRDLLPQNFKPASPKVVTDDAAHLVLSSKEQSPVSEPQASAGNGDLTTPYVPCAIHFTESNTLEYVQRDVPTVSQPVQAGLDVLVTVDTREPIGWRIYGWSRIAPPAENGADSPSVASAGNETRDEPLNLPTPEREAIALSDETIREVIEKVGGHYFYAYTKPTALKIVRTTIEAFLSLSTPRQDETEGGSSGDESATAGSQASQADTEPLHVAGKEES